MSETLYNQASEIIAGNLNFSALAYVLSKEIYDQNTIMYIIGATLSVLSIVIIINQIQIRKQLRQIQEQLEQKDKPE